MEFCEGIKYSSGIDRLIVHCLDHGPIGSVFYGDAERDEAQMMFREHEAKQRNEALRAKREYYMPSGRPRKHA